MKKRVNHEGTWPRAMIKQFLKHGAAGINYSSNVAKAINFIGRRPGYGSSVTVTAALLQPVSYLMPRVPRGLGLTPY